MVSSHPLDEARHTLDRFDSGEPDLDGWLKSHAVGSDARRITRTFVWTEIDTTSVIGYYALMGHVLVRDSLPRALGSGSPREIPAILIARLALDKNSHGQGLGGALLADALERALLSANNVGARFVVVDALHEKAVTFYEHHGFRRIPETFRLVQKVSAIEKALLEA